MNIEKQLFGSYQGRDIYQFTLENANGMQIKIMDFGATITSITIPDSNGKPVSIACGFDKFDDYFSDEYKANSPYFGCTVGRYCSQIKDARFEIEGKTYELATNCGPNNLHGGTVGFDKKVWESIAFESKDELGVIFNVFSADLEEGFPGNVEATVTVKLTNKNEIIFDYSAKSDKATPMSMTNHSYFNLSGFQENVEGYTVKVNADKLITIDDTGAATGVQDISGTINDLREGRTVGSVQSDLGDGFEHFYIFDNDAQNLNRVAEVEDKESGRKLEVFSTEPCMLFYTAKYMSDALRRNNNEKYGKYQAFACETHRWPNGPNLKNSPCSILKPGEKFTSKTIIKINW
jgi:aldose 1-epimerase